MLSPGVAMTEDDVEGGTKSGRDGTGGNGGFSSSSGGGGGGGASTGRGGASWACSGSLGGSFTTAGSVAGAAVTVAEVGGGGGGELVLAVAETVGLLAELLAELVDSVCLLAESGDTVGTVFLLAAGSSAGLSHEIEPPLELTLVFFTLSSSFLSLRLG